MTEILFWKDKEKRLVNHLLFSSVAENFAKEIKKDHDEEKNERGKNTYPNKPSQIRKFYDEIVQLNLKATYRDWETQVQVQQQVQAAVEMWLYGRNMTIKENWSIFICMC